MFEKPKSIAEYKFITWIRDNLDPRYFTLDMLSGMEAILEDNHACQLKLVYDPETREVVVYDK